jgi:hypothetical protein
VNFGIRAQVKPGAPSSAAISAVFPIQKQLLPARQAGIDSLRDAGTIFMRLQFLD